MKDLILSVISELKVTTPDDLYLILTDLDENIKKSTFLKKLASLENEKKVLKIIDTEIETKTESYILGPVADVKEDTDLKKLLLEKELFPQSLRLIKWDLLSRRIFTELIDEIELLKENILKQYKDSKSLELDYFDVSLKYHEYYNFFHQLYSADFLLPIRKLLNECRSYINKLEL